MCERFGFWGGGGALPSAPASAPAPAAQNSWLEQPPPNQRPFSRMMEDSGVM
jgi:hypothetical protein